MIIPQGVDEGTKEAMEFEKALLRIRSRGAWTTVRLKDRLVMEEEIYRERW